MLLCWKKNFKPCIFFKCAFDKKVVQSGPFSKVVGLAEVLCFNPSSMKFDN